jgi:tetratricopeptide (TPR) repeat protein/tRNA A-37 threonylcarbamoyl transferase component Bud32
MARNHDRTDELQYSDASFVAEATSHDGPATAGEETVAIGTHVGPYIIVDTLGAGAMGVVYAALDPRLDRKVAIKMVRANAGEASKGAPRLLREAQALAQLSHPNVVPVFDVGQHGTGVFLAMELVQGEDLRRWLLRRPPHWREIVGLMIDAGRGLAAAHAAGIVHRDFKPDNVLLDRDGRARVTDFGLARGQGESDAPLSVALDSHDSLSQTLTRTGSVVGTPSYMAPEQHTGKPVDARADQYAYCVSLYEALYGERPFVGRDLQDLANRKWAESYASDASMLMRRGIPPALHAAILRGLHRKPADRFPDMNALLAELVRVTSRKRQWWWLIPAGAGLVGACAAVLWLGKPDPCPDARASLETVWNDGRTAAIATAFERSQTAAAIELWPSVRGRLDAYGDSWVDAHSQICNAALTGGRGDPELDAGMLCLAQGLAKLGGVLDVLEEGSRTTVHSADTLVGALNDPHACHGATARLESPQLTRERQTLRESLDLADVRLDAAQYGTARELALAVERDAAGLGIVDLQLEAQLIIAIADARSGRNDAARSGFASVFWAAQAEGLDELALRAATRQVFLIAAQTEQPKSALVWMRHAEAQLERLGDKDPLARAKLLENGSMLYDELLQEDKAEQMLRDALAIRLHEQSDDHPAVSMVRNNLALRLSDRGAHEEALALLRLTYKNRVLRLGRHHPDVAMSLVNEARVLTDLGRGEEAMEQLAKAEPIIRGAFGDAHPMLDALQMARGAALIHMNELDAARIYLMLAITTRSLALGADSMSVAHVWNAIGITYHLQRDAERARPLFARAIDIFATHGEQGAQGRAYVLANWATLEIVAGEIPAARERIEDALAIFERLRPDGHADVTLALTNLAQVELAEGDLDRATATLDRVAEMSRLGLEGRGRASMTASMRTRLGWLKSGVPADAEAQLVELKRKIEVHDKHALEGMIIDQWLEKLRRGETLTPQP